MSSLARWIPLSLLMPVLAAPALAKDETKDRHKVLAVPVATIGTLSKLSEKRIDKALTDALASAAHLELLTDRDRAAKPDDGKDKGKSAKASPAAREIEQADLRRAEAAELAGAGKHAEALAKLQAAIAGYEKSWLELVDFTKLADAYTQAGLAAFAGGGGVGEAGRLFEAGKCLQPTLVIDRRKQDKELLALFDGVHARLDKAAKSVVTVSGVPAGAEAFVDGVKLAGEPLQSLPLPPGTHYLQVRGEGWQAWGQVLRLKGKPVAVTAKVLAVKTAADKPEVVLQVGALADCARTGGFVQDKCRQTALTLAKQTGAAYLAFFAVRPDRFGRPSVHPFLMEAGKGAVVLVPPVDLAVDLADVQTKAGALAEAVDALALAFPKAKALAKVPTVFTAK